MEGRGLLDWGLGVDISWGQGYRKTWLCENRVYGMVGGAEMPRLMDADRADSHANLRGVQPIHVTHLSSPTTALLSPGVYIKLFPDAGLWE